MKEEQNTLCENTQLQIFDAEEQYLISKGRPTPIKQSSWVPESVLLWAWVRIRTLMKISQWQQKTANETFLRCYFISVN